MLRKHGQWGAALVLSALLGGCNPFDRREWTVADSGSGGMFRASWGGMRADRPGTEPSDTIQRIRGVPTPVEPLRVEPGNVWPQEEAPRATLANPDAALRGVPPYRPNEGRSVRDLPVDERPGGPLVPPRSESAPVEERGPRAQRRGRAGMSSPPPQPLAQPAPDRLGVLPPPPGAFAPPAPRSDGQIVLTPGGPVTTTGGTGSVQSFTTPGGGGGVIHRDGNVTTVVPSGGQPQTFVTPR